MSAESLEANTSPPHIPRESVLLKIIGFPIKPAVGLIRQLYYRIDAYPLYALNTGLFLGGLGSPIDTPLKLGWGAILGLTTLFEWLGYETATSDFRIATHLVVNRVHYHGLRSKRLSTGEKVSPGQLIGGIDFSYNIPQLEECDNLIATARIYFRSAEHSLRQMALMCQKNDPVLEGIDVFYGASHIVRPFIEKLGFDIFDIENPFRRIRLRREGYNFVRYIAGENSQWQQTKKNFRNPREAFISRAKLVELYGNPNFGS